VCIVCIERVCWIFVVKMFAVFSSLTIHKWVLKQRFGSFVVGHSCGRQVSQS